LQRVAVYRSYVNDVSRLVPMCVLQCVAACCSVSQCVAVDYDVSHLVPMCVLQCVAVCYDVSRLVAMCVLQCAAVCCSKLQRVAACCSVLQHALSRRSITHMVTMCRAVKILKSHFATELSVESTVELTFGNFY